MKRGLRFLIVIIVLFFTGCGGKKQSDPSPVVPVNLYTVQLEPVLYYDNYPATVQALNQVNLLPQVQGYITNIFVKDGSQVHKGQLLYEIDKRLYQAAYESAVANLKVAQGNKEQAQQDQKRYEYLNSYHAVAKQLYDHAVIALQNANNQVASAAEGVRSAKTNLGYSAITAPFDGTLGFSQVKPGNYVNPGQTVLNTISSNDPMAVDFVVNEKQIPAFEQLLQGKKKYPDSLFTIQMPDNSLYPFTGKISVIDRAVDPQTGSIRVRLVFPNPSYSLKAGMSCVLRVHNQDTQPQMVVPSKAIVEQMGEYFVYVAKDTVINNPKANKDSANIPRLVALERKVQPGQIVKGNTVIKSGINAGDRIVVDGIQSLHSGVQITTANRPGPATGGRGGR